MKILIILVVFLALKATETRVLGAVHSRIPCSFENRKFSNPLNENLKKLLNEIGQNVLSKVKNVLTDGLQLGTPKEVNDALLKEVPNAEGVFEAIGDLLLRRADQLSQEYKQENPSAEAIFDNVGLLAGFSEAEEHLTISYNNSLNYNGPSSEGIFGNLGGFVAHGLGNLVGGSLGDIIKGAGDIIGHLFFVIPEYPINKEVTFISQPNPEGVLSNVGNLLKRGAGRLSRQILRGLFTGVHQIIENIFLARGHFHAYPNLRVIADDIILEARQYIHHEAHPEAKPCVKIAEKNFTELFDSFLKNGKSCVNNGHVAAANVIGLLQDIVYDSFRRVEEVHREAGFCYEKFNENNAKQCLDHDVPALINQHREVVRYHAADLSEYVKQFSQINADFDVCVTRQLGTLRKKIYNIVNNFHTCLPLYPSANANARINTANLLNLKSNF